MNWRDEYDLHADAARRAVDAQPVESLIEQVRGGRYGNYYGIWYSIAQRASLERAGWVLFDVLHRNIDYLYRYHCAAALIALLQTDAFQPVQLSGGAAHDTPRHLDRLRGVLEARLGPRK